MYPSALVLISALSIWSLCAAAAPVPFSGKGIYARSLSARSPGMTAIDSGIQARMVDDVLEEREGEGEGPPVDSASSAYEQTPSKPKHHHHHYTVDTLNAYLSSHHGHHHHRASQRKVTAPTTGPVTDSAEIAGERPPAGAEPATEAAPATNAPQATEVPPAPATDAAAAAPADAPPVMRRAFFWDDMEDLD